MPFCRRWSIFLCFCLVLATKQSYGQISLTATTNADSLVRKIAGAGITISNAKYKGGTYSAGIFKNTNTLLLLDSGIALTTGYVVAQPGGNGIAGPASLNAINKLGLPGDEDLKNYSGDSNLITRDACSLEFDFIPQGDSISVSYVFASEEYPMYNCGNYNDIFAFLISGPGYAKATNIALIPGSNLPVSINTINDGTTSNGNLLSKCQEAGPGSPFTQYYVNNSTSLYIIYNGMTVTLTAKAKVTPCATYHIKLAIADVLDDNYDSGVFIAANSFKSQVVQLSTQSGLFDSAANKRLMVEGCSGTQLRLSRAKDASYSPSTVKLVYKGTATYGIDYNSAPQIVQFATGDTLKTIDLFPVADNIREGDETVNIFASTSNCTNDFSDSITIIIKDSIAYSNTYNVPLCSAFAAKLSAQVNDTTSNKYTWSTGQQTKDIFVTKPGTYTAIHEFASNCFNLDTFYVAKGDPVIHLGNDTTICNRDSLVLDSHSLGNTILWSDGSQGQQLIIKNAGKYWVQVTTPAGCYAADTMSLSIKTLPIVDLGRDTSLCSYERILLNAYYPGATYQWSNGSTEYQINVPAVANMYKVAVSLSGCVFHDSIFVGAKKMPVADAGPDVYIQRGGSAKLTAAPGPQNDIFKWTPSLYLSNADIANPYATVPSDYTYLLTVTSKEGCFASDQVNVFVKDGLHIPNSFSPNGDGINDTWRVPLLNSIVKARVSIYDRNGQTVFSSNGYDVEWDGTLHNKPLPIGTYYYVIEPNNGLPLMKGWIQLVR